MERIEAFEQMLCDIQKQAAYEEEQMQKLKAAGKEKSATYRQFFGNRFFYIMSSSGRTAMLTACLWTRRWSCSKSEE